MPTPETRDRLSHVLTTSSAINALVRKEHELCVLNGGTNYIDRRQLFHTRDDMRRHLERILLGVGGIKNKHIADYLLPAGIESLLKGKDSIRFRDDVVEKVEGFGLTEPDKRRLAMLAHVYYLTREELSLAASIFEHHSLQIVKLLRCAARANVSASGREDLDLMHRLNEEYLSLGAKMPDFQLLMAMISQRNLSVRGAFEP